jgi:hypothetical protein
LVDAKPAAAARLYKFQAPHFSPPCRREEWRLKSLKAGIRSKKSLVEFECARQILDLYSRQRPNIDVPQIIKASEIISALPGGFEAAQSPGDLPLVRT